LTSISRLLNELQTSEKVYLSYRLEVHNHGGHSSLPEKDNAIYHLADGLARLARFEFPVKLNETTRMYFEKMSKIETGETARDMLAVSRVPIDSALIGTGIVAKKPEPQAQEAFHGTPNPFPARQEASSGLVFCIVCGRSARLPTPMPRSP